MRICQRSFYTLSLCRTIRDAVYKGLTLCRCSALVKKRKTKCVSQCFYVWLLVNDITFTRTHVYIIYFCRENLSSYCFNISAWETFNRGVTTRGIRGTTIGAFPRHSFSRGILSIQTTNRCFACDHVQSLEAIISRTRSVNWNHDKEQRSQFEGLLGYLREVWSSDKDAFKRTPNGHLCSGHR